MVQIPKTIMQMTKNISGLLLKAPFEFKVAQILKSCINNSGL